MRLDGETAEVVAAWAVDRHYRLVRARAKREQRKQDITDVLGFLDEPSPPLVSQGKQPMIFQEGKLPLPEWDDIKDKESK